MPPRRIVMCAITLFSLLSSNAQLKTYDNGTTLFYRNNSLNISALSDTVCNFSLGNQALTNEFSGTRIIYLSGNVVFSRSQNSYSLVGIHVINNQNGKVINNVNTQLYFTQYLRISKSIFASLGADIGIQSMLFKSTSVSSGGGDLGFDMDVSIGLMGKRWKVGTSFNHVTRPTLAPINNTIIYPRYLSIYTEYQIPIAVKYNLRFIHQSNVAQSDYINRSMVAIGYKEQYEVGFGLTDGGLSLSMSLKELNLGRSQLRISGAYQFPIPNDKTLAVNLFELNMGVVF